MLSVIHQTDIFHPYLDADDYWDLACQFALHDRGCINLEGIILDTVPIIKLGHGDPSITAVNQLNYLTGNYISNVIGTNEQFRKFIPEGYFKDKRKYAAVHMIEEKLIQSKEKVAIELVGGCSDIAKALRTFPELFREKCRGIYLNGGTSNSNSKTEYNVSIDVEAFYEVFQAPCSVYWLPSHFDFAEPYKVEQYATYYKFRQGDIIPYLSSELQNYFMYGLSSEQNANWLSFLKRRKKKEVFEEICNQERNMWSTAGILHASGKTVDLQGNIMDVNQDNKQALYEFQKIKIERNDCGGINWSFTKDDSEINIIVLKDIEKYEKCMTIAMKSLLTEMR